MRQGSAHNDVWAKIKAFGGLSFWLLALRDDKGLPTNGVWAKVKAFGGLSFWLLALRGDKLLPTRHDEQKDGNEEAAEPMLDAPGNGKLGVAY